MVAFMTSNLVFLISSYLCSTASLIPPIIITALPILTSASFPIFPSLLIITPKYFILLTCSISISPILTSQRPSCLGTLITLILFQFTFSSYLLSTSLITLRLLSSLSLESANNTMSSANRTTSSSPVDSFTPLYTVLFCLPWYFIYEYIK